MTDPTTRPHVLIARVGQGFTLQDLSDVVASSATFVTPADVYQHVTTHAYWRWMAGRVSNLRIEGEALYGDVIDLDFVALLPSKDAVKEAGARIEHGTPNLTGHPVLLSNLVLHEEEATHG